MKFLIAGLGNIGPEYADTRHNVGFMIADELAKQQGVSFITDRLAYYTEFSLKGKSIYLIKPTTYMNLSGKAINYWMQTLKISNANLLVVLDDLALPFGKLQLKPKGGDAGHNGLKSIQSSIGTQEYSRLRFGIGSNFRKGQQADYVLAPFDAEEQAQLRLLIDKGTEMIKACCSIGIELAMNQFNK